MAALVPAKPNFSSRFLGHKLAIHESRSSPKTCEFSISNLKTCGLRLRNPICCAANTPLEDSNVKFPRIRVGDPYKRLGLSNYASVEEIWGARNFLLQQYAQHERSAESIEDAFEKLLMKSFKERKKEKVNLKSRLKEKVEESPSWIKNLVGFVEVPAPVIIFRRLFLFSVLAGWSIMNAAEAGPALQVAVALGSCIYFLYDKTKSLGRAAGFGFGSLVVGWICGSLLGPSIAAAAILPVTWTLELTTSIVAFVFMFLGCTFLK